MLVFFQIMVVTGFELAETGQRTYHDSENIDLFVGILTSDETQVPFDYFSAGFCMGNISESIINNLGQGLTSDSLKKTPYSLQMSISSPCNLLCHKSFHDHELAFFRLMIDFNYRSLWYLDDLPSGLRISLPKAQKNFQIYGPGLVLGYKSFGRYYVYNHFQIIVKTHENQKGIKSVVGFYIQQFSLRNQNSLQCNSKKILETMEKYNNFTEEIVEDSYERFISSISEKEEFPKQELEKEIIFTYSVLFEPSTLKWANRWSLYVRFHHHKWLDITRSFAIVLVLAGASLFLFRKISRDRSTIEELTADLYIPPTFPNMFNVIVATGVQLFAMSLFTLLFGLKNFIRPEERGVILTSLIGTFTMSSILSGFVSGIIHYNFAGCTWLKYSIFNAILFPTISLIAFMTVNFALIIENSCGTASIQSVIELLLLWTFISIPLSCLGFYIGYKYQTPIVLIGLPRASMCKATMQLYVILSISGFLPFWSIASEIKHIMKSIWHQSLYNISFNWLFLYFLILVATSSLVSIMNILEILQKGNPKWFWRSLLVPGSSSLYLFIYSLYFYFAVLGKMYFTSTLIYFSYMIIICLTMFLITGAIGFFSSLLLIRKLFPR